MLCTSLGAPLQAVFLLTAPGRGLEGFRGSPFGDRLQKNGNHHTSILQAEDLLHFSNQNHLSHSGSPAPLPSPNSTFAFQVLGN